MIYLIGLGGRHVRRAERTEVSLMNGVHDGHSDRIVVGSGPGPRTR
jgi:hypothetical protein